jgi:hypothetical protein
MIGELLTLPLRIGVRGTGMVWRTAEGVAGRAVMSVLQVVQGITQDDSPSSEPSEPRDREQATPVPPRRTAPSVPAPSAARPAPAEQAPPPVAPEPVHVSAEPELVREEAEPGAEDGAGASITIDPPWKGYDRLGARDVIERLSGASAAEVAAVQLYESSKRSRQTVLEAAERQLKRANGSS